MSGRGGGGGGHAQDKADRDNHANQLNSNNDAFWSSRGSSRDDGDDDEDDATPARPSVRQSSPQPELLPEDSPAATTNVPEYECLIVQLYTGDIVRTRDQENDRDDSVSKPSNEAQPASGEVKYPEWVNPFVQLYTGERRRKD